MSEPSVCEKCGWKAYVDTSEIEMLQHSSQCESKGNNDGKAQTLIATSET